MNDGRATESRITASGLRDLHTRYRTLVERIPAVTYVDALDEVSSALYMSPQVETMLGYPPEEWLADPELFVKLLHPEDHERVMAENARTNATGEPFACEYRLIARDGRVVWVRDEAALVRDEETGHPLFWQGIMTDVTERRTLEERLRHRALHDPLTGLANRDLFVERLADALARAGRSGGEVAVMFADLDNFKHVNDSLGHEAGDGLLVEASERLRGCMRPGDTVARFGGDEFTLLVEDVADEGEATRVARRVAHALRPPFVVDGHEIFVTASVGIAFGAGGGAAPGAQPPERLLRNADAAMYRAKEGGRDRHEVFRPEMGDRSSRRLELDRGLRRALESGELVLHYQPQVSLAGGGITGLEALVRWEHPELGLVPPGEFVPLAEETGLIVPLGRWVLGEACRQAEQWRREEYPGGTPLVLSVNLSARQFRDAGLVQDVARVLGQTGLCPNGLVVEITEGLAMEDAHFTITTLRKLKDLGVRLAIDDFGTGYSSLSYLKRFPVDVMKVDRSIVAGVRPGSGDSAIVSATITLAHALGLEVVAEGVESAEEAAELRALGCDKGQGYHWWKPLPAEEAAATIRGNRRPARSKPRRR